MTTRAGLAIALEKAWRDFLEHPPKDVWRYGIRMTSGTTGSKPLVVVNEYSSSLNTRFKNNERVLVCFGSHNIRLAYARHVRCQDSAPPTKVLLLDGADITGSLAAMLEEFRPDCICGFPSFVMRVAQYLSPECRALVRSLQFAGEMLTDFNEQFFREHFPQARISITYILNEIGPVSAPQCKHLGRNRYHPGKGVVVELEEMNEEGVGELLVSKKLWKDTAVERYRTGDMARIDTTPCPCGALATFEVMGRLGYDYIKIAGALMRKEEFDRVALLLKRHIDDYRAEVREVFVDGKPKGSVTLRVYSAHGPGTQALAEEIGAQFARQVFVTPTQTLADLVAKGVFAPLRVEFSAAPFPIKNKEVKLIRL
ncbi:MAG: hypothetical protein V4474_00030 [Patescibacteria group bacterium]